MFRFTLSNLIFRNPVHGQRWTQHQRLPVLPVHGQDPVVGRQARRFRPGRRGHGRCQEGKINIVNWICSLHGSEI